MPACPRIQAPGSLGRAGPKVDHRNPLHKGDFKLRMAETKPAWPPQAPGLAQRWTTGILSTSGVLSSASVAAPAPQAPGPRLP
eukprot:gene15018-biopygen5161